jgi:hypothetical protein
VVANDSLSGIAARAATSLDALLAANDWPEGAAHPIFPGDVVALPAGAAIPEAQLADPGTPAEAVTQDPEEQASPGRGDGALPDGAIPFSQFDQVTAPPSDRSPGDPIGDPLEDGRYYADRYALSADGTRVEFTLVRFFTTDECLARHSIAPDSDEADGCFGYEIDASSTAHVSMPVAGGPKVLVQLLGDPGSDSYWYLASSEEFGQLLAGTGPPWRDRWIRGGAFVHLMGGDVGRVDITLTGS